jgi:hypothetical protein
MKLSRWRAKIVTSLLPQPSVLVQVALIVGDTGSVIGAGCFFFCHMGRIFGFESV